jgi:hypothetical protein
MKLSQVYDGHLEPPVRDDRPLWDIWLSAFHLPLLIAADALGLFAFLHHAPATAAEVAGGLALSLRSAEAMLGTLTALGCLVQYYERFHLTELASTYLVPASPYYYGGMLHVYRSTAITGEEVERVLRQGKPFRDAQPDDTAQSWASGELSAEQATLSTAEMHSLGFPAAVGMARLSVFGGVRRLLDVGGGSGCFSIALAGRHPTLRCTVLDLAPVCALAGQHIFHAGLQERIDTCAANMFGDPWPSGYDAVLLSNILHDWDRASCLQLARQSYAVLPPGGHFYVHEVLLADGKDGPLAATTFSLLMLFAMRGQQFSAATLASLLTEAGFCEITVVPAYGYYSLVCASKP